MIFFLLNIFKLLKDNMRLTSLSKLRAVGTLIWIDGFYKSSFIIACNL